MVTPPFAGNPSNCRADQEDDESDAYEESDEAEAISESRSTEREHESSEFEKNSGSESEPAGKEKHSAKETNCDRAGRKEVLRDSIRDEVHRPKKPVEAASAASTVKGAPQMEWISCGSSCTLTTNPM